MTKKTSSIFAALLISGALTWASCGADPDQNAKSIHVDSTNVNGTAPVEYGPSNPADTTHMLQSSDDTGRRSNTEQR